MPTLKQKALKCAINNILNARDRDHANERFKKWEVFHGNFELKRAVEEKKAKFKEIKTKFKTKPVKI